MVGIGYLLFFLLKYLFYSDMYGTSAVGNNSNSIQFILISKLLLRSYLHLHSVSSGEHIFYRDTSESALEKLCQKYVPSESHLIMGKWEKLGWHFSDAIGTCTGMLY
jgi:hypothetical protein